MKIVKTLSALVGGIVVAAGILANASPANALQATWNFSNNFIFSTAAGNDTIVGDFTYDDINSTNGVSASTITPTSVTVENSSGSPIVTFTSGTIGSLATTASFTSTSGNDTYNLSLNFNSPLTSATTVTAIAPATASSSVSSGAFTISLAGVGTVVNASITSGEGSVSATGTGTSGGSTGVPFEVPGGATIPVFGSILALGAMRKFKTSFANSVR